MPKCLYCQQDNSPGEAECSNCGMPLPEHADSAPERRQRRFLWFCIALSVFGWKKYKLRGYVRL